MKTHMKNLSWCMLLMLVWQQSRAQTDEKALDAVLQKRFPQNAPGAVAIVAKNGKILYHKAFGMADIEQQVPMKTTAVFRIGSNTKQFTAAAILRLSEEGKLSLDDEITKFIPDYPVQGQHITIRHLLSHTSGIRSYTQMERFTTTVKRQELTPAQLTAFFRNEPMDFVPGTRFWYNNSGYVLLGYIIELITGKSYAQYISEQFFTPLGMFHSFFDSAQTVIPGRIRGYKQVLDKYVNADYLSMSIPYAAGSLLSTSEDLFRWYDAVMHDRVVSKRSLREAQTSYRLADGRLTGYGYGWQMGTVQDCPSVKHSGAINGFQTFTLYLPAQHIFVAILSNNESAGDLDIPAAKMAAIALNKPYQFKAVSQAEEQLSRYTGRYKTNNGERVIALQDGQLYWYAPGALKSRLVSTGTDSLMPDHSLSTLQFTATGFVLHSTGLPDTGTLTGKAPAPLKKVAVPPAVMQAYCGRYSFAPTVVFEVIMDNGRLYGQVGQDRKELLPASQNRFYAKDLDAVLVFNKNEEGKVVSVSKEQNGVMEGKRLE